MIEIDNSHLNIAAFYPETTVLGPGKRAGIWVQGCPFHCPGCIAPDWIPQVEVTIIPVEKLVEDILSVNGLTGLTISGGEPMLQASALAALVKSVRQSRSIDVICFTGYFYETLINRPPNAGVMDFLEQIDLLIDGPYLQEKNDNRGLRGSSNQRFIFLTDRLKGYDFENYPRSLEIHISNNQLFVIGIPDGRVNIALKDALKRLYDMRRNE